MGIRQKILFSMLGATLFPLLALFSFSLIQQLGRTQHAQLSAVEASLGTNLASAKAYLSVVANQEALGIGLEQAFFADADTILSSAAKNNKNFKSFELVDLKGVVQTAVPSSRTGKTVGIPPGKGNTVLVAKVDETDKTLLMAVAVETLAGQKVGYLVGTLRLSALFDKEKMRNLLVFGTGEKVLVGDTSQTGQFSRRLALHDLGLVLDSRESFGNLLAKASTEMLATFIISLVSGLLVWVFAAGMAKRLADPVTDAAQKVEQLAKGKLDLQISARSQDETGRLAKSFNSAVSYLREMIGTIQEIAVELDKRSKHLSEITAQASEGSVDIAHQVEKVAATAGHVAELIENTSAQGQVTHQAVGTIQGELGGTIEVANKAQQACEAGLDVVARMNQQMQTLKEENARMAADLNQLHQQAKDITRSAAYISSISEQVTLLSLNASIEAERAGELGLGFAVVAKEVGKLAGFSREASQEINLLVRRIQEMSSRSVNTMESNTEAVIKTNELARELTGNFHDINELIEKVSDLFSHVSRSSESITTAMKDLDRLHQAAAFLTTSSSSVTETMSASIEELSASSMEVSEFAEQLGTLSNQLVEAVKFFSTQSGEGKKPTAF